MVYGPGGGAAYTVQNLSVIDSGGFGHLLELRIYYPNLVVEGWIDGIKRGSIPMTGWNGSSLPKLDASGNRPMMNIFGAGGSQAVLLSALLGINYFNAIELEVPLKAVQ